jgi:AFG3 family protein
MDGFGSENRVIVLAATNRKELLDPALTRPGRFDRNIEIMLPDIDGRKQIFKVHLQPIKLNPAIPVEEYAKRLATLTPGFSGADIANLCNEAAIIAARAQKEFVEQIDFEKAADRVIAGLERKKTCTDEEEKIIAYHESGHAVVSWFLEGSSPLIKLTIIPRSKGSLGYAQYLPNELSLYKREELYDQLV